MAERAMGKERLVQIETDAVTLEGNLALPEGAGGLVVFVHGSGSSRHSPRNRYVAEEIQTGGLGTLLFDLLTAEEEEIDLVTRHLRFDIDMLARRTVGAVDWLRKQPGLERMPLGTFGSSTGAAAALIAAAERPDEVRAVVSRGGRPDLAAAYLPAVKSATLLIVGERDEPVIGMNQEALARMNEEVTAQLKIVPGATHLFEEPGALERVAELARDWFRRFVTGQDEIHFQ